MISQLVLLLALVSIASSQINFPSCNTTYSTCITDPGCNSIFGETPYTSCTGSNGCQAFGLNYNNIVSEYFCEDNCLNAVQDENNNFVDFQSCVSNLITADYCGVSLTNCQKNTGTNNCAPLINTATIANCLNTNSACNIQSADQTTLSACFQACLQSVTSTNQLWNTLSGCISGLGSPCYTNIQNCIGDQPNCGTSLPAVDQCVATSCPTLFNTITASFDQVSTCYLPCFQSNTPATPSEAWTTLVGCYNTTSPSPSPSPSPSDSNSTEPSPTSDSSSSIPTPSNSSDTSNSTSSSGVEPTSSTKSSILFSFGFLLFASILSIIPF